MKKGKYALLDVGTLVKVKCKEKELESSSISAILS
jgi:hypothetical protein